MRTLSRLLTLVLMTLMVAALFASGCADETGRRSSRSDTGAGKVDAGGAGDVGGADVTSDIEVLTCGDGVRNGQETDIDCGGPDCDACSVGAVCDVARDCESGMCRQGVCAPATCEDGLHNGQETDVDCGGPRCDTCPTGSACGVPGDCTSGVCEGEVCTMRACGESECGETEICIQGACHQGCGDGEDEMPCPTLDFTTDAVTNIAATSATLNGTLIELPVQLPTDHGFCWSTQADAPIDERTCESLGAPAQPGAFSYDATGFVEGQTYWVHAYFATGTDTFDGNEVSFTATAPSQTTPTGVSASNGTSPNYVRVSWNAVAGADQYRVFRDGLLIATVTGTGYDDTEAGAGGLHQAPVLTATLGGHSDRVALAWSEPSAANGATHSYTVTAVRDGLGGDEAVPDTGYRGAYPVTHYELEVDGGAWTNVGQVLSHDDTDAPQGNLSVGGVSASDGQHSAHVALVLSGTNTTNGASRTYRLRAVSVLGAGSESAPAEGYRGVGSPSIQWQRSSGDSDANYTNLAGATGLSHNDTSAPANGAGRYYRAVVTASGASEQISNSTRGFRAALPTVVTNAPQELGTRVTLHGALTSLGAPNPTAHGFCWGTTPNPDILAAGTTTCENLGVAGSIGSFSFTVSNASASTTYHARAYATTNAGTAYGANVTFELETIPWEGPRIFTTCGNTNRTGPTQDQCDGAYSNTTLAGEVTTAEGIQQWTVPATALYRIEVLGAKGGDGGPGATGGAGASMAGDVVLTQGQVIHILVGQRGGQSLFSAGGGGGGGTFVVLADNTPLVIAGGGGGGAGFTGSDRGVFNGGSGLTTTAGGDSSHPGGDVGEAAPGAGGGAIARGGSDGYGGGGASAAGGGGFVDRGGNSSGTATPGLGFLNGAAGGAGHETTNWGGFGGGGGGRANSGYGGGAGGYSGGGGGSWNGTHNGSGGGGGSFNSGTNQSNTPGANTGHGQVTIDLL